MYSLLRKMKAVLSYSKSAICQYHCIRCMCSLWTNIKIFHKSQYTFPHKLLLKSLSSLLWFSSSRWRSSISSRFILRTNTVGAAKLWLYRLQIELEQHLFGSAHLESVLLGRRVWHAVDRMRFISSELDSVFRNANPSKASIAYILKCTQHV